MHLISLLPTSRYSIILKVVLCELQWLNKIITIRMQWCSISRYIIGLYVTEWALRIYKYATRTTSIYQPTNAHDSTKIHGATIRFTLHDFNNNNNNNNIRKFTVLQ